jgi:acetylornithine/LysW-gamma-L-lysine aminotransferase
MTAPEIQSVEDAHLAKTYARKPVVLVQGRGALVYDATGKEYVDCAGGYGTCIVGHSHPRVAQAISEQSSRLISCHSSTYNDARARFLVKLMQLVPKELERVYMSNSGAEAVEAAIKIARKATGRRKIVAMKGGYHGKTLGALSATWDSKYRKSFEPLLPDFIHIPYGDEEAAKSHVSEETAAIIVEPLQGEGGVKIPPPGWLPLLKDLSRDNSALLVTDEIQTGFGRTGRMLASDHYGVVPDILCLGKGVASGLPIGLTLASDRVMGTLAPGEHTTTFGGNPVVCAAAAATIDVLLDEGLVDNAARVGEYLRNQLVELQQNLRIIREVRGMGLMVGVEMRFDVLVILQDTLRRGILLLDAGRNVLRFLPPLCISQSQVDQVLSGLRESMEVQQTAKLPS